jgi:hypothetical protein
MGRKEISVGTAVSRAIADEQLPGSVSTGVIKAIYEGGELIDYVLEEVIGNIGLRAERMYAYAKNHYTHGLPAGQYTVPAESIETVVETALVALEDAPVTLDYVRYGPPNNLHIGWIKLIDLHGYNPATNQLAGLTATKGTPVYLHDMVVVVPALEIDTIEPRSIEQWGIAAKSGQSPERIQFTEASRKLIQPTPIQADPVGTDEYLRVEYVWVVAGVVQRDSLVIPVSGYNDRADYFHVRYVVGGVVKYWMYLDGAGTYPELDALFDAPHSTNGSFFPFAYFRYNGQSEIADTSTPAYKTTKKLLKYLGMNYDQVAEAIEANPGIDDVRQAMLMMAVPATTTNELERRYLWEFFNDQYLASDPAFRYRSEDEALLFAAQGAIFRGIGTGTVIQDTRTKMTIDNQGIYKRRKAGSIGAIGTHDSSFATNTRVVTIQSSNGDSGESSAEITVAVTSHYYRRQISHGFYDEIQVVGLRTMFYIYDENWSIADDQDTFLLIPLDHSITSQFTIPERELLYSRSLHYVFNSLILTKVSWYQTEFFQFVLLAVAIVATVVSYGSAIESVSVALAAGGVSAAAYTLLVAVVKFLVTQAVFRLFVKAAGIEAAFVVSILAAVMGIADSFPGTTVAGAPSSAQLLAVSTGLSSAISYQLQADMQALASESLEFEQESEEDSKALEAGAKLLENSSILSPFVIFGEKPEDFYNRTVHSGNIGVVGIEAISSYVEYSLRLPQLNDTLGRNGYA